MQLQIKHGCIHLYISYITTQPYYHFSTHHKLISKTDKDLIFSTAPKRLGTSKQWISWLFPYE